MSSVFPFIKTNQPVGHSFKSPGSMMKAASRGTELLLSLRFRMTRGQRVTVNVLITPIKVYIESDFVLRSLENNSSVSHVFLSCLHVTCCCKGTEFKIEFYHYCLITLNMYRVF